MRCRRPPPLALALVPALLGALAGLRPAPAHAYSTRVHIMIANELRAALVDADDGSVPLRLGDHAVVLAQEDFEALRDFPLAFRAGAVGPDNMVFPGMTDPSHALGQRPFEQCELLYEAAVVPEERAYALGCFLHGATDSVAHHYVNFMTGETFTLTPITAARETDLRNVARHILAESAIQEAAYTLAPDSFADSKLLHTIPTGFVLRAYFDQDSPLWQLMSEHARAEYDAAVAENPGASLPAIVASLDVAPADHLVLSPVYLASIDDAVVAAEQAIKDEIAALQSPQTPGGAELLVTAGDDGVLGTEDDHTACALTCPELYAKYFVYVGLLAPRYNAQNEPLPSAFEKISDELRDELGQFHAAYLETIGNLSATLNTGITGMESDFGLDKEQVQALFEPMITWADDLATIDYDTLLYAILPDWIIALDTAMQTVGINVDIAAIVAAVFEPIIAPIKEAIYQGFIAQAEVFLEDLIAEVEALKDEVKSEYEGRLSAAAHPELDGHALDHFYTSGLFAHSFNIAAAAIANHEVVLPVGDPSAGPASFDASYSPSWMQAGLCPHLAGAIFPLGLDVAGALSVREGGQDYPATLTEDSPVECHDGSLSAFADAPTAASCVVTPLAALLLDPVGSVSRAYPPSLAAGPLGCEGVVVPGLPEPEPGGTDSDSDSDGGTETSGGSDGGSETSAGASAGTSAGPGTDASGGTDSGDADGDGGCGCRSAGGSAPLGSFGLAALALLGWRRRRRPSRRAATRGPRERRGRAAAGGVAVATTLTLAACGGDDMATGESDSAASESTSPGESDPGASSTGGETDESGDESESTTGDSDGASSSTGGEATSDTADPSDTSDTSGTGGDDLLELLDGTTWHGEQTRDGLTRAYELRFDTASLLWSETRNPYGPARLREMRAMMVAGGDVHTTVIQPQGWPVHPENGRQDDWTLELDGGVLRTTRDGVVEEFTEGPWPAPDGGLTAIVRTFEPNGVVDQAFCDSGLGGFDYKTLFDFARGLTEHELKSDVVAGARLFPWIDNTNNNQFSVNDVDGFDHLGGTELTDTFNFVVTYTGAMVHPGGAFALREANDSVEDAVWVFQGDAVGSDNEADLFFEVHGFAWPDLTPDAPSVVLPAGEVPIEAILIRCTEAIKDVELETRVADGPWAPADELETLPVINDELFPPAL
ncbi:MAG: hypothetical protein H6713_16035 [Myxococcales bacterium]|nr:hypothetical protein [Myxococcales bacterium]